MYPKLENLLIPVFNYCLSDKGSDYFHEIIDCLNLILYNSKVISEQMWIYYPIISYLILGIPENISLPPNISPETAVLIDDARSGWAIEHIEKLLGCFKNYISKGKEFFLNSKDFFGTNFVGNK